MQAPDDLTRGQSLDSHWCSLRQPTSIQIELPRTNLISSTVIDRLSDFNPPGARTFQLIGTILAIATTGCFRKERCEVRNRHWRN